MKITSQVPMVTSGGLLERVAAARRARSKDLPSMYQKCCRTWGRSFNCIPIGVGVTDVGTSSVEIVPKLIHKNFERMIFIQTHLNLKDVVVVSQWAIKQKMPKDHQQ